jgi:hypothetical protein
MMEMPYSSVPEAMAPSTKYFIADSAAVPLSRSKATMAYSDSDRISMPRYIVSRLPAEMITLMPSTANSASTKYSPRNSPRFSR